MLAIDVQSILATVVAVGATLGIAFAYYRRTRNAETNASAEQRAQDWRDTAEQRNAVIADMKREIADMRSAHNLQIASLRASNEELQKKVARLEGELAELKRHDITGVGTVVDALVVLGKQREAENTALFTELRVTVFPMIQDIHQMLSAGQHPIGEEA